MFLFDRQPSTVDSKLGLRHGSRVLDEAESSLLQQRKHSLRTHKSGKCALARKRLYDVFHMRKYYRAIMGLTGLEAMFVIWRLMLETESLRYPPGNTHSSLVDAQQALCCISMPIHVLFVLEQPFKWWALRSRRFCKSVLMVMDALVCLGCFGLNIYNIYDLSNRPRTEMATARQLALCGSTHTTHPPNTAATFAIVLGLVIIFRLWCIHGYIHKSVLVATRDITGKLTMVQHARDDAEARAAHLESTLQERNNTKSLPRASNRMPTSSSSHTRSSSRRSPYDTNRESKQQTDSGGAV